MKRIRMWVYFICVMCLFLLPTHSFSHVHNEEHTHHEQTLCEVCEGCCHLVAPLPISVEKTKLGENRIVFSFPPEMTYQNVLLEKEKRPPRL